jgi:hypothetical protein
MSSVLILSDLQRLQRRFTQIKSRCGKHPAYRNIGFEFDCPRVAAVLCLAKFGPLPDGQTIDRIDPRGPYSLKNIRYADRLTQSVNRIVVLEGWRRRHAPDARAVKNV